jgi:uncharacterized membrane protein (GlpM family)
MQFLIRFFVGGLVVSLVALIGDIIRPRGFAGLFGAAPSVALATLMLTALADGNAYAAVEARSMVLGAAALLVYVIGCLYLLVKREIRARTATISMLPLWGLCAGALSLLCVR